MKHIVGARSRVPGKASAFAGALALAFCCLSVLNAAEFEVVDKLAVAGYTVLESSAEVRGLLGVSTGAPQAALDVVSTGTASNIYSQIWRDGSGVVKASMTSQGVLYATLAPGVGDNLGNHTATQNLNLANFDIVGVSTLTVSSITTTAAGVTFATNVFVMNGNVGVGTTSPVNFGNTSRSVEVSGQDYAYMRLGGGAVTLDMMSWSGGISELRSSADLGFKYAGAEKMRMGANGIGIGSSFSSQSPLHVHSALTRSIQLTNAVTTSGGGRGTLLGLSGSDFTLDNAEEASAIRLRTQGADRLVLGPEGNVGISSGTPAYRLVVSSGAGEAGNLLVISTGMSNVITMNGAGAIYAARFYGDASGLYNFPAGAGGDNLGTHIATQTLQMQSFGINTSSSISAAHYQINGSTVLAILPGSGSFALGVGAGQVSLGDENVFIGDSAGAANTSGVANLFAGFWAGKANTTGDENTFIGDGTGASVTLGNENTAVGAGAFQVNVTGEFNISVGAGAGFYNLSSGNSLLGYRAGYGTNGSNFSSSTLVGYRSGYSLTTGSDNIFLGWQAGYGVNTGTGNIVIGYGEDTSAPGANNELNIGGVLFGKLDARTIGISTRAPQAALDVVSTGTASNIYAQIWRNGSGVVVASMTSEGKLFADGSGLTGVNAATGGTGGDNLGNHIATMTLQMQGFGINTSSAITAAVYQINGSTVLSVWGSQSSVAVGPWAGDMAVGSDNTFMGAGAGSYNTSSYNTFVGYQSGGANTTGWENTFLGYYSGYTNTTGTQNTFLGVDAGYNNTAGIKNVFLGGEAADMNRTGSSNVSVGFESGYNNRYGSANAILGYRAGYGSSPNSYSSTTLLGYGAGLALTTGSDNIFLGWQAGYTVTTGTGNIVIGYGKDTSAPGANNELNIGGVLFGKLDTRTIGIGTNNPLAALEVRSYSDGNYTAVVSTSSTAGVYSVAVSSAGITHVNNLVIENRTSDPAAPVTGQIWFRVD